MQRSHDLLRLNAAKCRDLAEAAMTPAAREVLSDLAIKYEQDAKVLEQQTAKRHYRPSFIWELAD